MSIQNRIIELKKKGLSRSAIAEKLRCTEWKVRTTWRSHVTDDVNALEPTHPKFKFRIAPTRKKGVKLQRVVVLSDIHIPFHDQSALGAVMAYLEDLQPDGIVLAGDIIDCLAISSYRKDPARIHTFQDELNETQAFLALLRDTCPKAWIKYMMGNHEDRLERTVLDRIPEIACMDDLSWENLLRMDQFGIEVVPESQHLFLGDLLVTHGEVVRKHAGYTAKAHREKYGCSVLVGHVHRLAAVAHTNHYGTHYSIENGYLARPQMGYVKDPDWQQGFTEIHYADSGAFYFRLHAIRSGKLVVDGTEYQG